MTGRFPRPAVGPATLILFGGAPSMNDVVRLQQVENTVSDEFVALGRPMRTPPRRIMRGTFERHEGDAVGLQVSRQRVVVLLDADQEFSAVALDEGAHHSDQLF